MDLTLGKGNIGIWRRLRWQRISLAGGLAIAISLAAALGVFDRERTTELTTGPIAPAAQQEPAAPVFEAFASTSAGALDVVYYIVGSQVEASTLQQAAASEEVAASTDATANLPMTEHQFFVAGTPEEAAQVLQLIAFATQELSEAGIASTVIDLR